MSVMGDVPIARASHHRAGRLTRHELHRCVAADGTCPEALSATPWDRTVGARLRERATAPAGNAALRCMVLAGGRRRAIELILHYPPAHGLVVVVHLVTTRSLCVAVAGHTMRTAYDPGRHSVLRRSWGSSDALMRAAPPRDDVLGWAGRRRGASRCPPVATLPLAGMARRLRISGRKPQPIDATATT